MALDITNIISLLSGEKVGTPNTWVNMASTTQHECHNYKLTGSSLCMTDIPAVNLFIELPAFDPVIYKENKKGFETGKGQEIISWRSIEPTVSFVIIADETIHNLIQRIKVHETKAFTRLAGSGAPQSVAVSDIEVNPSAEGELVRIEVKLTFKDSLSIMKLCCGSYFDEAPFDECDGDGETGDPNIDPDCEGIAINITLEAGPVLVATPNGIPDTGDETFTWYLNGAQIGMGDSIVPVLPGVYRIDYTKANCSATDSFTFQLPCTGFEVDVFELVMEDGTVILFATPNLVSTVQWQIETAPDVWEDVPGETDLMFQPLEDGNYRAVATNEAECEAISNEIEVDVAIDCETLYTFTLENIDDVLTVTINDYEGEGTPAFQWFLDTGSGFVEQVGTESTFDIGPAGIYKVIITLDGCVKEGQVFINCEAVVPDCGSPCNDNLYQEFLPGTTGSDFPITEFFLLDPTFFTADQINGTYQAHKNGVKLTYITPAEMTAMLSSNTRARTVWTIDYVTQTAKLHTGWPKLTTDLLSYTKLK